MDNKTEKQRLLIEYLISSADTFALCKSIVKADYFDPEFRKAVEFIHEYYDKYTATPTPEQIYAETEVRTKTHAITRDQISYCSDEIEKFCRYKAIEQAIIASSPLLKTGNEGKIETMIRDALSVSLTHDLGLDYFADPLQRLRRKAENPPRTPTGWKEIDEILNGGLARTEMLLVSANSGGGKSIVLANLARNFVEQGLNVLYITLEISEDMVAERFDSIFTGVDAALCQQNTQHSKIATKLDQISGKVGKLFVVRKPSGTNANAIRAYLKEFELTNGYIPDMLIVDYLDKMSPNEKVSADNISEKDKLSSEQLNDIGFDYNMFVATASQQNRSAIDAQELNQGHIAGGLTKINAVDIYISIILTASMKASGEIGLCFLKSRSNDGLGKTVYLKWEGKTLRILNPTTSKNSSDDTIINKIAEQKANASKKQSLLDVMDL